MKWVPSLKNPADFWTRAFDSSDWYVKEEVFQQIEMTFGLHTIDRMASHMTRGYKGSTATIFARAQKW